MTEYLPIPKVERPVLTVGALRKVLEGHVDSLPVALYDLCTDDLMVPYSVEARLVGDGQNISTRDVQEDRPDNALVIMSWGERWPVTCLPEVEV